MEQRNLTDADVDARATAVELPTPLVDRVDARVERTEFETVDEYVTYVLEEVLGRVEAESDADPDGTVDREEVETRLRSLGYLD